MDFKLYVIVKFDVTLKKDFALMSNYREKSPENHKLENRNLKSSGFNE
jgi:hypothetical protein